MSTIVLATRNRGKIAELQAMFKDRGLTVASLDDFPDMPEVAETGATFEENALLKARAVSRVTGLTAVADDSGLEVDALHGRPGVRSARYAGEAATDEANYLLLLNELADVPAEARTARFVCVMVAFAPGGATLTARGTWEGIIAEAPRGRGGFGYDPVFLVPGLGRSAAELTPAEKNARSHRGKALAALLAQWADFWDKAPRYPMD